jgi:glycosyltransferase involved in cell wall biosynthesis
MQPLISILIPVFNGQRWIAETLQSAIGQTWRNKEIIVVDDGSTDDTLNILDRYKTQYIHIVLQDNQGAAAARNKALAICNGDYIQWLDADDLLAPDKMSEQMTVLLESGGARTLVSCAFGRFLYRYYRTKFIANDLWYDLPPSEWMLRKLRANLWMAISAWLVSRELTEVAGPWDVRLAIDDDGEYFSRVLSCADYVRFVAAGRVYCRMSGWNSLSHIGLSDRKLEAQWLSMKLQISRLRALEDSERVRMACLAYLQRWLTFFYPERDDIVSEMREVAAQLGGVLEIPAMPWKYSGIDALFGRRIAKRAQLILPAIRWTVERAVDRALLMVEKRHLQSRGKY